MAEAFLSLSPDDRRDALAVASEASGRPLHLLEKDVWVVWALETLFGSAIGANLVFKGGTSLSKAYSAIQRFSEDVDLTLDMRALATNLIAGGVDGFPSTPIGHIRTALIGECVVSRADQRRIMPQH